MCNFSIVTVSFNASQLIEETILSVLNQDFEDYEYIIIDGGSTDGTVDIIRKYSDKLTYWISEKDHGIYDAMNKAIDLLKGNWVNFMNAGDKFYDDNVLSNIAKEIELNYGVIFGDVIVNKFNITALEKSSHLYKKRNALSLGFNHQASFLRTDLAKKYKFNTTYKVAADFDLFLRVYRSGIKLKKVNTIVAIYDANGFSVTNNKQHYLDRLYSAYGPGLRIKILYFKRCCMLFLRKQLRVFFPKLSTRLEINHFLKNKKIIKI